MKVLAIFTCFNRKDKTKKSIETITKGNPTCDFTFIVVDDASTDGTYEALIRMKDSYNIYMIQGNGNLFYSGGMNMGMNYALQNLPHDFDYLLMMNDDVEFFENSVQNLISQSREQKGAVIVGAMCDDSGKMSYGAVKYISGYRYRKLEMSEWETRADTFNANCVLIPYKAFEEVGVMDSVYMHSLGDFDYGLSLKRAGYLLYQSKKFVGRCNTNSSKGTWTDISLSRIERIRKKESIKGAPSKLWFYFLRKNFGVLSAIKGTITPYVRILLGK